MENGFHLHSVARNASKVIDTRLVRCPALKTVIEEQGKPQEKVIAIILKQCAHFKALELQTKMFIWMDLDRWRDCASVVGTNRFPDATANPPQVSPAKRGCKAERRKCGRIEINLFV